MKQFVAFSFIVATFVAGGLLSSGCGSNNNSNNLSECCSDNQHNGSVGAIDLASLPYEMPDAQEIADLEAMRQEEKLARDVYRHFHALYGVQIFSNISEAEQTHTNRIKDLLDKYGLTDSVTDDTEGVFRDEAFTTLYTALIARGEVSVNDAYQVGYDIEVLDINDLDAALSRTDNEDITLVYENLRAGSEKHKSAFSRFLP